MNESNIRNSECALEVSRVEKETNPYLWSQIEIFFGPKPPSFFFVSFFFCRNMLLLLCGSKKGFKPPFFFENNYFQKLFSFLGNLDLGDLCKKVFLSFGGVYAITCALWSKFTGLKKLTVYLTSKPY